MAFEIFEHYREALPLLLAATISLLTWRFWKFTIRPMLYRDEPKELPYWIPFLGHARKFLLDFNTVIRHGRLYFKNTREPFSITVAGQTIYILTSAKDVASAWKFSAAISMDPISEEMYTRVGISSKSRESLFKSHPLALYNAGNPHPLSPTEMIIRLHQQQGQPGPRLDNLMKKLLLGICKSLEFGNVPHSAVLNRTTEGYSVSLLKLCIEVFIGGTTDAIFGAAIRTLQPELFKWFMLWEHSNWKFLFQLPPVMSQDMLSAKRELIEMFTRYCKLPADMRRDSSYFIEELERALREVGISDEEIGGIMILHYWAIVGNVYKIAFWMLAYMIQEPALIAELREEMLPAVHGDTVDESYLENCRSLESFFNEVLRLTVTAPMGRVVVNSTIVGGKLLRKGNKVMIPLRELHFDQEVWGPASNVLDATKFSKNPRLLKNPNFRPWGGGITMCPGRFLARRSIFSFLAILLSRYDITVDKDHPSGRGGVPKGDDTKPSPGVTPVANGEDVIIKLTPLLKT